MSHLYVVKAQEPLGTDFVNPVPVDINGRQITSIKVAMLLVKLQRYGFEKHVEKVLLTSSRPHSAESSVAAVLSENQKSAGPEWAISLPKILKATFTEFARQPTVFRSTFESIRHEYGANVEFLCTTGSRFGKPQKLMTTGIRARDLPQEVTHEFVQERCRGVNLYGKMLTVVYQAFCSDILPSLAALDDLLSVSNEPAFKKTIAIVSDSMFRQVAGVEGGDVFASGGKTCHQLTERLRSHGIHLSDYRLAIICVGANDTSRHPGTWIDSIGVICDYLFEELQRSPDLTLIMNTHIGYPTWPQNARQGWVATLKNVIQCRLSEHERRIQFFDWASYGETNPFLSENLEPVINYTDDKAHPNLRGLEKLIEAWGEKVPEVRCVEIELSDIWYPNGQF